MTHDPNAPSTEHRLDMRDAIALLAERFMALHAAIPPNADMDIIGSQPLALRLRAEEGLGVLTQALFSPSEVTPEILSQLVRGMMIDIRRQREKSKAERDRDDFQRLLKIILQG